MELEGYFFAAGFFRVNRSTSSRRAPPKSARNPVEFAEVHRTFGELSAESAKKLWRKNDKCPQPKLPESE